MAAGGNADGKRSEQVEREDVLRTVECLRGRLLAERAASRNAKEEADQLGNKLIELEIRLKEETKSRNRAERKLKSLVKKLEALEIFYVSDESQPSGFLPESEISSVSSVASSSTKEAQDNKEQVNANKNPNVNIQNIQELTVENPSVKSPKNVSQFIASAAGSYAGDDEKLVHNNCPEIAAQNSETPEISSLAEISPTAKETSRSLVETQIAKSTAIEPSSFSQNHRPQCRIKMESLNEEHEEESEEDDDYVDNTLALVVAVDLPKTKQRIDPVVLDATVKEVLDALRHAKEKLQTSMERSRMIKVG